MPLPHPLSHLPCLALRSSLVCKLFRSAANSDLVWENFLPSDHLSIQRSLAPLVFPSKKLLVLYLCRSFVLLEGGNLSFAIDKWTAKTCYMLGAKELMIASGGDPQCWMWDTLPESRFPEVAELLGVYHLQMTGRISTQLLSPNTTYHAYFSFKLKSWSIGFDLCPVLVSVSKIDRTGAYLTEGNYNVSKTFFLKAPKSDNTDDGDFNSEAFVHPRDDHHRWLKIDMGRYFNDSEGNVALLEMTLMGVEMDLFKSGLVVHGIEFLPLD